MASESFKFWDSYYDALKFLGTDERRGKFVMALCQFVFDGTDPEFDDETVEFGFKLVKTSAELSKDIANRARENGSKSAGRPRKKTAKKPTAKPTGLTKRKEEKGEEGTYLPSSPSSSVAPAPPDGGRGSADGRRDGAGEFDYGAISAERTKGVV